MKLYQIGLFFVFTLNLIVIAQPEESYIEWACLLDESANSFYSMDISNDNRYLALGGTNKTIIYDLNNDQIVLKRYNVDQINSICFSSDSKYLFTSGDESNFYTKQKDEKRKYYINVYETESGKQVKKLLSLHKVKNLSISGDSRYLIVNAEDPQTRKWIQIWDIKTWDTIYDSINKSEYTINFVSDSFDEISNSSGAANFWSDKDQSIKIRDLNKNYFSRIINNSGELIKMKISKKSERLVSINTYTAIRFWDYVTVRLWDFKNESLIGEFMDHEDDISNLAISLSYNYFATSGSNKIIVRSLEDGKYLIQYHHKDKIPIIALSFYGDDKIIFSNKKGMVNFWDFKKDSILKTIDFSDYTYEDPNITEDSEYYKAGSVATFMEINNATNGKILRNIPSGNFLPGLIISKKNNLFISYQDSLVKVFDITSGKFIREFKAKFNNIGKKSKLIYDAALSHKEKYILIAFYTHVEAWEVETGLFVKSFITKTRAKSSHEIESINLSPDDSKVVVGYESPVYVIVWDFNTAQPIDTLKDSFGEYGMVCIREVMMTNKNEVVAFARLPGCRIWDLNTREIDRRFNTKQYFDAVSYSPDYQFIASGQYSGKINIWNAETGKKIFTYNEFNGTAHALEWSDNGNIIYSRNYGNYGNHFISWRVPSFIKTKIETK